ncbi:MAG: hypothetical protein P4L51_22675, partial [Puia sp.]|nr:hypothetical protein [Puia sp.]
GLTPFQFAGNEPIANVDEDGLEPVTSVGNAAGAAATSGDFTYNVLSGSSLFLTNTFHTVTPAATATAVASKTASTVANTTTKIVQGSISAVNKISNVIAVQAGAAKSYISNKLDEAGTNFSNRVSYWKYEAKEGISTGLDNAKKNWGAGHTLPQRAVAAFLANPLEFIEGGEFGAVAEGVNLEIHGMEEWTEAQNVQAFEKAKALTESDQTFVRKIKEARKSNLKSEFLKNGGVLKDAEHLDHIVELQLNGTNAMENLKGLDGSVNSSFGSQIRARIKNLPDGTRVNKVTFIPAKFKPK